MLDISGKLAIMRSIESALTEEESQSSCILDREIETLKKEIEAKKGVLQYLNEQIDSRQADLDVQDVDVANVKEDIRVLKEKSSVLATYIGVITSPDSDDFPVAKLRNEMERYVRAFWAKLKPFNDRAKAVGCQFAELKDLRDRYMEAKQKADNSMI